MIKMGYDNNVSKFRSFIIITHKDYGCLLLKSSKKSNKDVFQLPGGRLDIEDLIFSNSEANNNVENTNLLPSEESFKVAAARELYEETGIDLRNRFDMLKPLEFDLPKKWRFFYLDITHLEMDENKTQTVNYYFKPIINLFNNYFNDSNIQIKLSKEHDSFIFERDLIKASQLVKSHSKGICSKALILFKENYMKH